MRKTFMFLLFLFLTTLLFAQTGIRGIVVEKSTKESLIGATVVLKGTTQGAVTGVDGSFYLKNVPSGKQIIEVSYIGYVNRRIDVDVAVGTTVDLKVIELESDAIGLNEIRVLANIAIDRQTPIAVSNIKPAQIEEKLGTQEFPEILKTTPGVYATKRGGGFGDADVRIRGFGSENVAVLINGMPVNGMENDKVYWSNWAGLADVTRTMQVQRGIGASKIAVPSVGGTINVITKTTDAKKGGNVFYTMGNDNYSKMGATFSTGLLKNDWAVTMMFSKTKGDGYVKGTPFEGYSYFFNVAKKINDRHQLAFTLFGAPQEHAQRYGMMSLDVLKTRKDGHRYNEDWGYLNGQFYSNSVNFYHKPVAILNHYFDIDKNTFLSSSLYGSYGMGGGGYSTERSVSLAFNEEGQIDWDKAYRENLEYAANGNGAGIYFQNSYNYHKWFGALSTLKKTVGLFNYLAGVDLRYYYGEHWQQADDLFGAGFVYDRANSDAVNFYNRPVKQGGVINYDNDGEVMWEGLFLQAEYNNDDISAFVSATLSNRSYRRYDFAQYFTSEFKEQLDGDPALVEQWENNHQGYMRGYNSVFETKAYTVDQVTEWRHFMGVSAKAGANYNFNSHHNVFVNGGYMQRQPNFSTAFQNYKNLINPSAVNEKVYSAEVGYGFRSSYFTANINAYLTQWNDKTTSGTVQDPTATTPDEYLVFNIEGVNARHMGIELDYVYEPIEGLNINGMVSIGDWIWANNVDTVEIYKDQLLVDTYDALYLKGIHVADAAQTTASVTINYEVFPGLKIGSDFTYFDRLYADFDLDSRVRPQNEGVDAERIPAYALVDLNMYYSFDFGPFKASVYGNMNNVLNTIYVADAIEGRGYYFGYGRTISLGLKIRY
ncbi:MAG: TonB-dependent receptor [Prolixibacteraceae bacterium]|nr:TonB-dependent receptor [Prolixibacteraceae bacterium]